MIWFFAKEKEVSPEGEHKGVVAAVVYDPLLKKFLLTTREDGADSLISGKGWEDYDPTPREGAIGEVDHEAKLKTRSFRPVGGGERPTLIVKDNRGKSVWVFAGTMDTSQIDRRLFDSGKLKLASEEQMRNLKQGDLAFEGVEIMRKVFRMIDQGKIRLG